MSSIRARLVLWVIGGLACGLMAALWATYSAVRTQIGNMFDGELRQVARAVHVREDWIGSGRMRIARPGFSFSVRAYDGSGRMYFKTVQPSIPLEIPQTFDEGYHFFDTPDGRWRIYTYVAPEGIVQVGQPLALRDALARDLSLRVVFPLLLLIPAIAVVAIWGLRRGLEPLRRTSEHIARRDATLLEPLPRSGVPQELLPLVEQINGLMARLSRTLDSQRIFLADAAHELRSPVAALKLQAQLAERASTAAARQAAFEELRRGIERATRLVQQLLDFARLEPGVDLAPAERVDIARLIREMVGMYSTSADNLGVDLGADTPSMLFVMGNESQLRSMVGNLIDNALRYTPRNGTVTVSACSENDTAKIIVIDGGPGIPPVERDRVFHRFHRVRGDGTPGNGLGLSIVKAVVERHGGILALEDVNPEKERPGLRVRIGLPAVSPQPADSDADAQVARAA